MRYRVKGFSPGHPNEVLITDEDQDNRVVAHGSLYLEDQIFPPEHGDESSLICKITWDVNAE